MQRALNLEPIDSQDYIYAVVARFAGHHQRIEPRQWRPSADAARAHPDH